MNKNNLPPRQNLDRSRILPENPKIILFKTKLGTLTGRIPCEEILPQRKI